MPTQLVEAKITTVPPQRFWKAYYAAVITVLYFKGLAAILTPDGLAAACWLEPLTLAFPLLLTSLVLVPIALLNTIVFVQPWEKMRAARWRHPKIWAQWISYAAVLLYATYCFTASSGLRSELLGVVSLVVLTALNCRFQQASHPHRLLIGFAAVIAVIPAFLLLHPVARDTR